MNKQKMGKIFLEKKVRNPILPHKQGTHTQTKLYRSFGKAERDLGFGLEIRSVVQGKKNILYCLCS